MKSISFMTSISVSLSDFGADTGITGSLNPLSVFVGTITDPERLNRPWKKFLRTTANLEQGIFGASKRKTNRLILGIRELHASHEALKNRNRQQEKLIKEKDMLIREIHHRVKNNLQISMSLLNLQASNVSNKDAKDALINSQRKMQTMALVHQKLYQLNTVGIVEMGAYIRDLVAYLKDCFNNAENVHFDIDTQDCKLGPDQAVPVGLILNEAITNSLKHAFPSKNSGMIIVRLSRDLKGVCCLNISDNGTGIHAEFDPENSGSLGMRLMSSLTYQLSGEFHIGNNNGTEINIIFHCNNQDA